jgi:hypothetical protein
MNSQIQLSRQKHPVYITDQTPFHGKRISIAIRRRKTGQQRPVTDKKQGYNSHTDTCPHIQKKQGCKHPGQADTSQNTGITQMSKIKIQQSVVNTTQQYQNQSPADHLTVDGCRTHPTRFLFFQRIRKGNTCNKKE